MRHIFQPRYQPAFCRTSNPESSAISSSLLRRAQLCCPLRGQEKRPCSNRLAQTHKPLPSQNNTFTRLRSWFVNTNQCPDKGSSFNTDCVSAKSALKPARRSTGAVATNTRVPEEQLNIP